MALWHQEAGSGVGGPQGDVRPIPCVTPAPHSLMSPSWVLYTLAGVRELCSTAVSPWATGLGCDVSLSAAWLPHWLDLPQSVTCAGLMLPCTMLLQAPSQQLAGFLPKMSWHSSGLWPEVTRKAVLVRQSCL